MNKNLDKVLGTMSDSQVAKMYGMTRDQVYYRRAQLGITACRARIDWRPLDHLMGVKPDAEIAKAHGLSVASVQQRRLKLKREGLDAGVPASGAKIEIVRRPPNPRRVPVQGPKRGRPSATWTPANLKLLGKISDEELARKIGVTRMTVWRKRRQLGAQRCGSGQ